MDEAPLREHSRHRRGAGEPGGATAARRLGVVAVVVVGVAVLAFVVFRGSSGGSTADGVATRGTAAPTETRTRTGAAPVSRPDRASQLPVVQASAPAGVRYGTAGSDAKRFFAPVTTTSGGIVVSSTMVSVALGSRTVGAVADYRVRPGLAQSATFRNQYVVQLMRAVGGTASSPKVVRLNGRVVAVNSGQVPVAAWFEGDHVVLVHRVGASPELNDLALGVINQSAGR